MAQTTDVMMSNQPVKSYGVEAGGFVLGMNTQINAGNQIQLNALIKDGELHKMKGDSEFFDQTDADGSILKIGEYQKDDGTFQRLIMYYDGSDYKMRAIEDDGTETTPTGGAGDVAFTSPVFGYAQISLTGYISNKDTAANGNLWSWNGTQLTAITSCPDNPEWLGKRGRHLLVGAEGVAHFSRSDNNPLTTWTGGAAQFTEGEFRCTNSGTPTGVVDAGTGTIIAFRSGLELHNINILSDGAGSKYIDDETQENTFTFSGQGITEPEHIAAGFYYIYIINEGGFWSIDPIRGKAINLVGDESGKAGRYWGTFDISSASLAYSPKEKMVVCTLNTIDTGVNNLILCYHESSKSLCVKSGNYETFEVVDGQLYGGSSIDGKIAKVFDDSTYTDINGVKTKFRVISEWDTITKKTDQIIPVDLFLDLSADENDYITVNIYADGYIDDPIASFLFTVSDVTDTGSITAAIGNYTMGVGKSDDESISDLLAKSSLDTPFYTYCWEVIHESASDCRLRNVDLQFVSNGEIPSDKSFPNDLFSL